MKEEHIARRMLDVDIPGKRRRGRPNTRRKNAFKRDIMTETGLKDDTTTNRAAWRKKINSYTSESQRPQMMGQARDEEVKIQQC